MKTPVKRHFVSITNPSNTLDSRGQITGADSTVQSNVPASIETLGGDELLQARQQYSRARYRVRIWALDSAIDTEHKIVFGARTLNIGHIENVDEADVEWIMLCDEEK